MQLWFQRNCTGVKLGQNITDMRTDCGNAYLRMVRVMRLDRDKMLQLS